MKTVLITGGAAGIGLAMGHAFGNAGYKVWITDVDDGALDEAPKEWRKSNVDVSDEPAMQKLFQDIDQEWRGLDTLCANAGTKGPTAAVEDIPLDGWRACLSVTLDGTFLAAKYAAPLMKDAKAGQILITSSTAGIHGYPHRAPYAAAKWAVIGLMKTLSMELGPFGIRANAICPGSVEGPRMERVLEAEAETTGKTRDEIYAGYASGTSLKTWVRAEDIANMAVFLASDGARFVSGQVISVDGDTFNPLASA